MNVISPRIARYDLVKPRQSLQLELKEPKATKSLYETFQSIDFASFKKRMHSLADLVKDIETLQKAEKLIDLFFGAIL